MCFSKVMSEFLLLCFKVCLFKISGKTDKFLLSCGNLFRGSLLMRTQCKYEHEDGTPSVCVCHWLKAMATQKFGIVT